MIVTAVAQADLSWNCRQAAQPGATHQPGDAMATDGVDPVCSRIAAKIRHGGPDLRREAHAGGEAILKRKPHPEQGFRACLGILRLRKSYGPDRLEAACGRAVEIDGLSYSSVASILKNNIDRRRRDPAADEGPVIHHQHLRGPIYFQ